MRSSPSLADAKENIRLLSQSLPTIIDMGSFRTAAGDVCRSKAPTIALSFRETQAWRVEEFSRAASEAIERGDLVVGVANARHMIESCAAIWYLLDAIEEHIGSGLGHRELYDRLGRLFVGSKNIFPEMPQSINVLTFIGKMDKVFPGFEKQYNQLSEISHPNWAGSAAIYSKRSDDNLTTYFGRDVKENGSTRRLAIGALVHGLEIFGYAYNRITDRIPAFVEACETSLDRGPA
ncbi:hypothetical protein [Bradyrhizobium diazoefficiens]|uniref:hypothetical protein n=1 Tax=Bradyrhizobium diazoefficiens TaxID=1355477 RepID=UPI00057613F9|nr:hypothetical protein [Bradyrhizobium diazoefficiens]